MFRVWPLLIVALILAACSSAPTRRESASAISTPHAWKPPADLPAFIDHSVGEEEISIQAMSLVGVPYRWGGNTPDAGFDCSGLVRYVVARSARVDLPRTTSEMSLVGSAIQPDEVAPGDLIYFNTTGRPHSHVGIYVGGYRFVNAPSTGGTVRIDYVSNPYWAKRFDGIRRVASANRPAAPFDTPQLITSVNPEPAPQPRTADSESTRDTHAALQHPAQTAPRASTETEPAGVQRRLTEGSADAFEPPPPSRSAAESQAAAEHATPVDPIAAFAGTSPDSAPPPVSSGNPNARTAPSESSSVAPAAAPASAYTTPHTPQPAPIASPVNPPSGGDDPIARFANGG
jgi:hypothetical protein